MSFCSYSKEYNENSFTEIDNRFLTKYLPEADGFAVKVYLYGLYLCKNADGDFSVSSMAEILKTDENMIRDAFAFWEDYDLVSIISHDPFVVSYLPVRSTVGRPTKINYDRYSDFNKQLQRSMQKVGKFVSYNESIKYMHFLDENDIQPQAFLLLAEYCINKQGESVSPAYIFNKAKKFIANGWQTYEQVERELSNYNAHEKEVSALFSVLSVFRKPDETDYSLYGKWLNDGFDKKAIATVAKRLKKGTMDGLNILLDELKDKGKFTADDIDAYLSERENLVALTMRIARKLGVKIGNPAPYVDEYTEIWFNRGFAESPLLAVAGYCLKTDRNDFTAMDSLLNDLYNRGVISEESVNEFLDEKTGEIKLLEKIRSLCGSVKKTDANLTMISTWHAWNFSDDMILEAASRSAFSASPLPYMNKILSDWKKDGIFKPKDIPEKATSEKPAQYVNPTVKALDEKADRERFYALLRDNARRTAEKYLSVANSNPRFKEITEKLRLMEITLAKAEIFEPAKLPALQETRSSLLKERKEILKSLDLTEAQLVPNYKCKKCSDTGFTPEGVACDCYKKENG